MLKSFGTRRSFLGGMAALAGAGFLAGAGSRPGFAQSATGSMIFHGGPILTMDADNPRAEAVVVNNGRIVAIGALADVAGAAGAGARVIDLQGRTLMPGFIDPHLHPISVVSNDMIDVSPMTIPTMDGVMAALRAAGAAAAPGEWVQAQLFDPSIIAGGRPPTLAELDAVLPGNPLLLMEGNGHVAYANSLALAAANVSRDTPDPPQGRYIHDAAGNLTGRLEETPAFLPFFNLLPLASPDQVVVRLKDLFAHAASVGCTGLHDCGIGTLSGAGDLDLLTAAMTADAPVRLRGMLVSTHFDAWEARGLKPGFGDDLFRVGGMKAWSDGSNQAQTGFMRENYLNSDARGALNYTPEALTEAIRRAHAGGWQVGVHANGDAGIDVTLDAFETVLRENPRDGHRHRIEHASVLHPEHIARMVDMGLSPSFLIGHVRWWGRAFRDRILGPERAQFYDPCASALAAGLRISLHSDWSVTPIEPLRMVEDAVARVMNEGGEVFFPDERIPVDAALRAVTRDAAWQCGMDDITGSLEVGKYADFVLLESDPTAAEPTAISAIKVSETWLGGEQRHGA